MFKGLTNLASMLKQAQQMGSKIKALNEELKTRRAKGSAGGGMVEVEVNGLGELLNVRIDPALFAQNDREMIEDLIPAAANQAIAKSKQMHAEAMQAVAQDMELPDDLSSALDELGGDEPPQE